MSSFALDLVGVSNVVQESQLLDYLTVVHGRPAMQCVRRGLDSAFKPCQDGDVRQLVARAAYLNEFAVCDGVTSDIFKKADLLLQPAEFVELDQSRLS